MISKIIEDALNISYSYLLNNFNKQDISKIEHELLKIVGTETYSYKIISDSLSYNQVQKILSSINEKEIIRKNKGVYYTPCDVVDFILLNTIKASFNKLTENNIHDLKLDMIPFKSFCFEKTMFDPTCGAGEFLISSLQIKLDLLDLHSVKGTALNLKKVVGTLHGNDINQDSVTITKIRLFLLTLNRYGVDAISGISNVLNMNFTCFDFVKDNTYNLNKFDIIVGNPPYVEDSKSGINLEKKYGNIYANVIENAGLNLKNNGVLGFVIPLSYVSTPRMKKLRIRLFELVPEQYILSYSDRPDCLFTSVHQKLCILIATNKIKSKKVYTSNYQYWYKNERQTLFNQVSVIRNKNIYDDFIPKLGNNLDINIFSKVKENDLTLMNFLNRGNEKIYLNMRATFWIKAFVDEHIGGEYKIYNCENSNFAMCLLNSSLFWWYWTCVSDCWHITRKELNLFTIPKNINYAVFDNLAKQLENQLEITKKYVGTKQTNYEYKHRNCLDQIDMIDDFVNSIYGLTDEESKYIKKFAFTYRIGGGTKI